MKNSIFKKLHSKNSFFILGNCWDALSARVYENAGYKALGTSSWALSAMHGVKDGENIDFDAVLNNVNSIIKQINIPLSVDMEKGYSEKINTIAENAIELARAGCSGINIEDSDARGNLLAPDQFAKILANIKSALLANGFSDFVVNARTDTYLNACGIDKITDTLARASVYQDAGADSLFVPGLSDLHEIRKISNETKLPLNVLNVPGIADAAELKAAGVNRFSLGNSVFDDMLAHLEKVVDLTYSSGRYASHYNHAPLKLTFN